MLFFDILLWIGIVTLVLYIIYKAEVSDDNTVVIFRKYLSDTHVTGIWFPKEEYPLLSSIGRDIGRVYDIQENAFTITAKVDIYIPDVQGYLNCAFIYEDDMILVHSIVLSKKSNNTGSFIKLKKRENE